LIKREIDSPAGGCTGTQQRRCTHEAVNVESRLKPNAARDDRQQAGRAQLKFDQWIVAVIEGPSPTIEAKLRRCFARWG
jgi:hypothetical protein